MNYALIYERLTSRAANRVIDGYTESHHIIPKCMGGNNSDSNLVRLTPEEHYLAHQLLVRIYPNHKGLKYALYLMTIAPNGRRNNNKMFGWIKRDYIKNRPVSRGMLGRKHTTEAKQKMKQKRALQIITDETKLKISKTKTGVKFTDEALASFREKRANNQNWINSNYRPCKETTKSKIGTANRGRIFDKIVCPHCGKKGAGPNMTRYHFDNCKSKAAEIHLPTL
ncbi:homing endonuclease [Salmonella phage KM16]|uniref:homing endonuclease n=1 Tax=Salmonella phage KM16 TaxID=2797303 RepID=UPI002490B3F0|nr:homing endonuclease [Salmonella phage KM16]